MVQLNPIDVGPRHDRGDTASGGQLIIFLSAVSEEFRGYRSRLRDDLMRASGVGTVIQEDFGAVGEGTLEGLDARIRDCAAVVHLIGDMSGFVPPQSAVRRLLDRYPDMPERLGLDRDALLGPDSVISYTHWEAYLAIHHDRKLLIAEAAHDAAREPETYRRDPTQIVAQQAHRTRLRQIMDRWPELVFVGSDDIAEKLLPLLAGQHSDRFMAASVWSRGIRQFDDYYLKGRTLDGREVPAPFGGRQRELKHLDDWLDDPGRDPRLLVSAPAGRGKSALLAKWMEALKQTKRAGNDGWQLVFVPISNRFQTNSPMVYLELLARQLSHIVCQRLIPPAVDPEPFWRNAVNRLIAGLADAGTPTLIVLDGLDEALGEERLANLLPAVLPPTLKVLVSARWIAGHGDGSGWLERLGWVGTGRPENHDLVVEPLNISAITNVLIEMGAPLADASRDSALVRRLADLTEGDPLMLRFYAEDLWLKAGPRSPITLATLDRMEPGFGAFFKVWLDDQLQHRRGLVGDAMDDGVDRNTTIATLAILGFAKGPLTASDLLDVGVVGFPKLPWCLLAALHVAPFRRFVIGDGTEEFPYSFSHPKVAQYVRMTECKSLTRPVADAFVAWGRDHVARIIAKAAPGKLHRQLVSRYALDHYAAHLGDVDDTTTAADYMAMVENGWRRAHEELDGGPSGFARDTQTAWNALRREGTIAHLGAQWRCALVLGSIRSLGTNLSLEILSAAVRARVLSADVAARYVELKQPSEESARALARIAVASADQPEVAQHFAGLSFAQLKFAPDEQEQAQWFETVVRCLLPAQNSTTPVGVAARFQDVAREFAHSLQSIPSKAFSLLVLAEHSHLPAQQVVNEALEHAEAIGSEHERYHALLRLLPLVEPERRGHVVELAQAECATFQHDERVEALRALASFADPAERERLLQLADEIEPICTTESEVSGGSRTTQVEQALASLAGIKDEHRRGQAIAALVPELEDDQVPKAIAEIEGMQSHHWRGLAWAAIAPKLKGEQHTHVAWRAWNEALYMDNRSWGRVHVLAATIPHLSEEQRGEALRDAIQTIANIGSSVFQMGGGGPDLVRTIEFILPVLPDELVPRVFDIVTDCGDHLTIPRALAILAPRLSPEELTKAVEFGGGASWNVPRSEMFDALAAYLSAEQLRRAIEMSMGIFDYVGRAYALATIAPFLDAEKSIRAYDEALDALQFSQEWEACVRCIEFLAPRLNASQAAVALGIAIRINDERDRAGAIQALAPRLSTQDVSRALDATLPLPRSTHWASASAGGYALAALVPRLNDVQLEVLISEVNSFEDSTARSAVVRAIADRVPGQRRREMISDALEAIAVDVNDRRDGGLRILADVLDDQMLSTALDVARSIREPNALIWSLRRLRSSADERTQALITGEALDEVIKLARYRDESDCVGHLVSLGSILDVDDMTRALIFIQHFKDTRLCERPLIAFAPRLSHAQREIAKEIAAAIPDANARERTTEALDGRMITQPPAGIVPVADRLVIALTNVDVENQAKELGALSKEAPTPLLGEVMGPLLNCTTSLPRDALLALVKESIDATNRVGGQEAVMDLHRAVRDACRWYP